MAENGVETCALARQRTDCRKHDGETNNGGECQSDPAFLNGSGKGLWPGEVFPACLPNLSQRFGDVHIENMGGGVLAGVIASPAVVAKIGQVRDVRICERAFCVQFRVNRGIGYALVAGK